jgi:hypothetical protein
MSIPESRRKHLFWLCIAIAIASTLFIFGTPGTTTPVREPAAAPGPALPAAAGKIDAGVDPHERAAPAMADHPATTPLPDHRFPLMTQLDKLSALSEAGDTRATCRLVLGAARCREQLRMNRLSNEVARQLDAGNAANDALLIALAAANEEDMAAGEGFCAGVRADLLPRPDELVRQRLRSFSPAQKTVLALMQSNGELRRLDAPASFTESALYVLPQFLADHTHAFLLAGYAAREPLALEGLILLHAPGSLLSPQSVGMWLPDPARFLHHVLVMQTVYGEHSVGDRVRRLAHATIHSMPAPDLARIRSTAALEALRWQSVAVAGQQGGIRNRASAEMCD